MVNDKAPITPIQVQAIRERRIFDEGWLCGYVTPGGTYMVATPGCYTDDGRKRDLCAILPSDIGNGRVVPVWIAVNPDVVEFLERELERTE